MLKKYRVQIKETSINTVIVEAENKKKAKEIAEGAFEMGEVPIFKSDVITSAIVASERDCNMYQVIGED